MGTLLWGDFLCRDNPYNRTPDLCRDRKLKAGNSLKSGGTDGSFQRPEELSHRLLHPYRTYDLCPVNLCPTRNSA
jgi:hypothetical protein